MSTTVISFTTNHKEQGPEIIAQAKEICGANWKDGPVDLTDQEAITFARLQLLALLMHKTCIEGTRIKDKEGDDVLQHACMVNVLTRGKTKTGDMAYHQIAATALRGDQIMSIMDSIIADQPASVRKHIIMLLVAHDMKRMACATIEAGKN